MILIVVPKFKKNMGSNKTVAFTRKVKVKKL